MTRDSVLVAPPVGRGQCLKHAFDVAVEDRREVMEALIDTVIRDAVLREVVRPNLLAPVARPDLRASLIADLLGMPALLDVEQPRAQDRERLRLVLELRLFILTGDDEPCGDVRNPNGGVGRIDALPAVARRAVDVDPQ